MMSSRLFPWLSGIVASALAAAGGAEAAFVDATAGANLTRFQFTWGAAFLDLDGDDDLDLYVGHHAFFPEIFRNDGTGFFLPVIPQPWEGPTDRHGVLPVPLGDAEIVDLLVTHGGAGGAGTEANELYQADGLGSLVPRPGAAGMEDPTGRSRCASAADYDGDLRVDVWIGKAPGESHNSLFRNVAPWSFTDVAAAVGLDEGEGTVGGIWGDWDDDGDPDLFAGGEEFSRPSRLWRNDAGTFTDVTALFAPALPVVSGADWGDWDEDGDLDLAVCDGQVGLYDVFVEGDTLRYYFNTRWGEDGTDGLTVPSTADTLWGSFETRGFPDSLSVFLGPDAVHPGPGTWTPLTDAYVGEPDWEPGVDQGTYVWRQSAGGPWEIRCSTPSVNFDAFNGRVRGDAPISGVTAHDFEDSNFVPGGPRLWRNDGAAFTEVTPSVGLPAAMVNPRDLSWVDFDNDGDLDLHVVDMGTSENPNAPDALFRNDGGVFVDVASAEGALGGTDGMGDGATWGDVDGDGDLDAYVAQGAGPRAFGGDGPALFLRNDGGGGSVRLELVGNLSGAAAIGTKVTARIGSRTLTRWLTANAWRGFADPREIHLGLGTASAIDSLTVAWPSGVVEVFTGLGPGRFRIDEGLTVLSAPPVPGHGWRIEAVRPQPARGIQTIVVGLEEPLALRVDVVDAAGRRVRRLHDGALGSGVRELAWDGRDDRGAPVAAGVYFFRLDDGRSRGAAKSVRLR